MRISPHWQALKCDAWLRCGGRCEVCGSRLHADNRHLHHLTYVRRGHERLSDVEYVCLACHGAYHPHHTFRPLSHQRIIAARRKKGWKGKRATVVVPTNPVAVVQSWASERPQTEADRWCAKRQRARGVTPAPAEDFRATLLTLYASIRR